MKLRARCPSAEKISSGLLYEWKLVLDVMAEHVGGTVAGITEEKGGIVEGMLFLLSPSELDQLSRIEEGGYSQRAVVIKTATGEFNAVTFVPERSRRDATNPLSQAYIEHLLMRARADKLPRLERDILAIYE